MEKFLVIANKLKHLSTQIEFDREDEVMRVGVLLHKVVHAEIIIQNPEAPEIELLLDRMTIYRSFGSIGQAIAYFEMMINDLLMLEKSRHIIIKRPRLFSFFPWRIDSPPNMKVLRGGLVYDLLPSKYFSLT